MYYQIPTNLIDVLKKYQNNIFIEYWKEEI